MAVYTMAVSYSHLTYHIITLSIFIESVVLFIPGIGVLCLVPHRHERNASERRIEYTWQHQIFEYKKFVCIVYNIGCLLVSCSCLSKMHAMHLTFIKIIRTMFCFHSFQRWWQQSGPTGDSSKDYSTNHYALLFRSATMTLSSDIRLFSAIVNHSRKRRTY